MPSYMQNEYKIQHNNFILRRPKHTFLSGFWISGKTAQNGLMNSKNLTAEKKD